MAIKPITPAEAEKLKYGALPEEVFEAVNELIAQHYDRVSGKAVVKQAEIVSLLVKKGIAENKIYSHGWLDFEKAYEEDWQVNYDRPGFNETYEPTFTFMAKKKSK